MTSAPSNACLAVVPIRSFSDAKSRLAPALNASERRELTVELAERVIGALGSVECRVLTNDPEVASWADGLGIAVLSAAEPGLNAAAAAALDHARSGGFRSVAIIHADLARPNGLASALASALVGAPLDGSVVIVPDRHGDGTNVLIVPTSSRFEFAYGPGSFARHRAEAELHSLTVVTPSGHDALGLDIDTPDDLVEHRQLATPACALAIAAHPDDVEFCAGATLARWASLGCTIHHLICTDGSKGTWDAHADLDALVMRRRREQADAAKRLGATGEVVWLGAVDGELESNRANVSAMAREIRRLRPDVVLAHDPWKRYRLHPDHRNAGFLALDAVVAARDPHFFPEHGLAPHRPTSLLLFEADEPNHLEPATEAAVLAKLDALEAHESQLETTHFYGLESIDEHAQALESFRRRERSKLAGAARSFGASGSVIGEAFHLIDDL